MSAAVRFEVEPSGRIVVDVPPGWLSDGERAVLRAALDGIRPALARVAAPPLPPRATWPASWSEAWDEREAIAAEGGALDPAAVADADLRVRVARGEFVDGA